MVKDKHAKALNFMENMKFNDKYSFSWMSVEKNKTILVLSSMANLHRILQSSQPTMMALLATGTTLPSLQSPECLQLIKGDMREVSFCTSFPPPPYDHSTLCCSTSSSVENHVTLPTNLSKHTMTAHHCWCVFYCTIITLGMKSLIILRKWGSTTSKHPWPQSQTSLHVS